MSMEPVMRLHDDAPARASTVERIAKDTVLCAGRLRAASPRVRRATYRRLPRWKQGIHKGADLEPLYARTSLVTYNCAIRFTSKFSIQRAESQLVGLLTRLRRGGENLSLVAFHPFLSMTLARMFVFPMNGRRIGGWRSLGLR